MVGEIGNTKRQRGGKGKEEGKEINGMFQLFWKELIAAGWGFLML